MMGRDLISFSRAQTTVMMAIAIIFLVSALSFWPFTLDDAYISARYALNASQNRGLVFNPGERVMGYTNLLLVMFEYVIYRLGGDGIVAAKLLGIAAGLGTLGLTIVLARMLDEHNAADGGLLGAALLAVFPFLPLSSVMGLESSLFAFLELGALVLYLNSWQQGKWRWRRQLSLSFLFVLATLTRPEGLGFVFMLVLVQGIYFIKRRWTGGNLEGERGPAGKFAGWRWLVVYIALLIPVLIILTVYYGSPIPNTFFAKTASNPLTWVKYVQGMSYISIFFNQSGFYVLIPLLLWPFLTGAIREEGWITIGVILSYLAYVIYVGGDWVPGFRFLLPVLPFCFALAGNGLVEIWPDLSRSLQTLSTTSRRVIGILALLSLVAPGFNGYLELRDHINQRALGYHEAHFYVGEWLRDHAPADAKVALMDVGIIGYVSDLHIIDFGGLINERIAKLMHHDLGGLNSSLDVSNKIAKFVLSQQPDFIVLAHNYPSPDPFFGWSHDKAIYESVSFQKGYRYLFTRRHAEHYYLSLYEQSKQE
jgi:hypothetical protein